MRYRTTAAVGSPTMRLAAILAATFLLALTLAGAGLAGSRLLAATGPIVVDSSGDGTVTTIAAAIEMASDGDTILVRPGTYTEAVVIDKDITLAGDGPREDVVLTAPEGGPTIRIGQTSQIDPYAVLLDESAATLSGLTLRGEPSQVHIVGGAPVIEQLSFEGVGMPVPIVRALNGIPNAIVIAGDSEAVVRNNVVRRAGPVAVHGSAEPLVEGNMLSDGAMITVYSAGDGAVIRDNTISGALSIAIFAAGRGNYHVEGNIVTGAGGGGIVVGHHLTEGIDPVVQGNTIRGSRIGIQVGSAAAPYVAGNTIELNETGLLTGSESAGLVAEDNDFADNVVAIVIGRTDGRFEDNTILGGSSGIVMDAGGSPTVVRNTVEGASADGVRIGAGTSPTFEGNRLCGNGQNLAVESGDSKAGYLAQNDVCGSVLTVDASGSGDATTIDATLETALGGETNEIYSDSGVPPPDGE